MSEAHQFFTELKLLAEDFERLREENKALKAKVADLEQQQRLKAIPIEAKLFEQRAELLEENKALRNAGDAVCESPYLLETDPAVIAWRAATNGGKQPQ